MKTTNLWLALLVVGFGLMAWSYFGGTATNRTVPWAKGLLLLEMEGERLPGRLPGTNWWPVQVRLLGPGSTAESVVNALEGRLGSRRSLGLRAQLCELLAAVPGDLSGLGTNLLAFGRMPVAGEPEVLAGCQVTDTSRVLVADREFRVVGSLKRDAAVWANSYLLPQHERWQGLFKPGQRGAYPALACESGTRSPHAALRDAFKAGVSKERSVPVWVSLRVGCLAYAAYLGGMALLLAGGSGLAIACIRFLAGLKLPGLLGNPLQEMDRRSGLLWSVHLGYFGLVVLAALVIYELPMVQKLLLGVVRNELDEGAGPLAVVAKTYGSGNIVRAAVVTFLVNFFFGSLACLTVPSLLLAGAGVLVAGFRALLWGMLLAPTVADLAAGMLPHSFTLWLEGEGYILAAFLGLLIPIALFQARPGQSLGRRYLHAAGVNLKGLVWSAIVLGIAAIYEAIEVIAIAPKL